MIRIMRITNGVLILMVGAAGFASLVKGPLDWATTVGKLLGLVLWGSPFALAWLALGVGSKPRTVRKARWANIAVLAAIALFSVVTLVIVDTNSNSGNYFAAILAFLIFTIPAGLNIKVLNQLNIEFSQLKPSSDVRVPETYLSLDVGHGNSASALPQGTLTTPPLSNYLLRHWRGDLSLATSFWINLVLLSNGIGALLLMGVDSMEDDWSLRIVSFACVSALLMTIFLWVWGVVGVWRSSEKHVTRGGGSLLASLAKVSVVIGMISTTGQLGTMYIPMLETYAPLMFGYDPLGEYQATVLADGRSLLVRGILREGSAKRIEQLIEAAPSVTTLMLASNGGRLAEAKWLARYVERRGLNTYVEGVCASACTFVFLAGKDRSATPNAKIGFHLPVVPWGASKGDAASQYMVAVYKQAGLPDAFISRVLDTPSSSMWYPTRSELMAARVITRTSFGGETNVSFTTTRTREEFLQAMRTVAIFAAMDKRYPIIVSQAVDRGWKVKQAGGNDSQIYDALRTASTGVWTALRETADDAFLEKIARIALAQRKAARSISYEACALLLDNKLDISSTLPKELVEGELALMLEALTSTPKTPVRYDSGLVSRSIVEAISRLPPELIDVVVKPEKYTGNREIRCDADVAVYEKVLTLPPTLRAAALGGLLRQ